MVKIIADDYGMDKNIDSAIIELLERGVIHGTSIMICSPVLRANSLQSLTGSFSKGLHVDLTHFVKQELSLINLRSIFSQVNMQIVMFKKVFGHLPDYIDSHQNIHRKGHVFLVIHFLAIAHGIKRVRSIVDFNVDDSSYTFKNLFKRIVEWPFSSKVTGHLLRAKGGSLGIISLNDFGVESVGTKYELPVHPSIGLLSTDSKLNERRVKEYQLLKKIC